MQPGLPNRVVLVVNRWTKQYILLLLPKPGAFRVSRSEYLSPEYSRGTIVCSPVIISLHKVAIMGLVLYQNFKRASTKYSMPRYGESMIICTSSSLIEQTAQRPSNKKVRDIIFENCCNYSCCQKCSRKTLFFGRFGPIDAHFSSPATTAATRHDS